MILCIIFIIVILVLFLVYYYREYKFYNKEEYSKIFPSIESYPEIKLLEDNWNVIRDEIPTFDITKLNKNLSRNIGVWDTNENKDILKQVNRKIEWVTGWSNGWFHFPIVYLGKPINGIEKILPKTFSLIKQIPSIYVAGFSILLPGTTLPWHVDETGTETNSLAMNLGLDSDNSILYVKGTNNTYNKFQKNGKAIIFDSNYEHQVINNSKDNIRVILYVDFKINQVNGTVVKGFGDASKLGYPTVNVKLDKDMDCGLYTATCIYGECVIAIDKSRKYGEINLKHFNKSVDNDKNIYLRDLQKIIPKSDMGIIGNYYRGCK